MKSGAEKWRTPFVRGGSTSLQAGSGGGVVAVDDLSLEIERGEFFSMLGPSGCGKTTTLRMIGGFEEATEGTIYLGDADVTGLPPFKRDVNTVFQNYALFPHLTVFENVAFGLRRRKVASDKIGPEVKAMLDLVELPGYDDRKPSQLSGGQQQRVAIARVLAGDPVLILADEPTGNLDTMMSREVMDLLEKINEGGTTIVMVTHTPECASRASRQIHLLDGEVVDLNALPSEDADRSSASLASTLQ